VDVADFSSFTRPSDVALDYAAKYAQVLARWAELFSAASGLITAGVELGEATTSASKEFEALLLQTARFPWTFFSPDAVQELMEQMSSAVRPPQ
jgi:hypothetical protein